MRFIHIILFIIINTGCKRNKSGFRAESNNQVTKKVEQNNKVLFDSVFKNINEIKLPISSDLVLDKIFEEEGEYKFKNKLTNNKDYPKNFFSSNCSIKRDDNFFYKVEEKEFYPIFKHLRSDYIIIGSLVEYYGENDIKGILFALSSFDKQGLQKDYLIIFNRFLWEVNIETNFIIDKDFQIKIDYLEENYYDSEKGEFIAENEQPEIKKYSETYFINDNGVFQIKK